MPKKLELQVAVLESRPEISIVFGRVRQFRGEFIRTEDVAGASPPASAKLPGTALIRRDVFDKIGRFETQWRVGEFVSWGARAAEGGIRDCSIDGVVLYRRVHESNLGVTKRAALTDYAKIVRASIERRRRRDNPRR
ncbi:hypothetical protein ACFL59_16290 [Planctomycetota bacterium]